MVRILLPITGNPEVLRQNWYPDAFFEFSFPTRYIDIVPVMGLLLQDLYYETYFGLGIGHQLFGKNSYSLYGLAYSGLGYDFYETGGGSVSLLAGCMVENRFQIGEKWSLNIASGIEWRTPVWGRSTYQYPVSFVLGFGFTDLN